jgi:probable F420-dependent oxidoreductase
VRIGVVFPQNEIGADPAGVKAYAEAVQALGYDHLMAYDHVLGADTASRPNWGDRYTAQSMFHEVMVLFGYLAGVTPGLELVTAVIILPQRQTALVAKQAAEIDILTGGNFRFGVGIGWNDVEYEGLGENFSNRGRRFEEQIELMRRLWTEPVISFEGKYHRITAAGLNPLPTRRPLPLWFGASAEAAIKRAAQSADGYFPQHPLEGGWPATFEKIHRWRAEAGRDRDAFGIDQRLTVGSATPDEVHTLVEQWRGLGATHLTLGTTGAGLRGPDAHIKRLAELIKTVRA